MADVKKTYSKSVIGASSEAAIYKYDDIPGLIITSVTTPGLLNLNDHINFMEDYVGVSSFTVKGKTYDLFAVYDGHGGRDSRTGIKKGGHEVAEECVDYLPRVIKNTIKHNNNIDVALVESFIKADQEHLIKDFPENVGSTAITILRSRDNDEIYVANLGDSRAVICKDGKVFFETRDFDWTNPEEQARLGITKGKHTYIIKTDSGDKKFILNGRFLNGEKWNLAASRSFGDYHFKLDSMNPPVTAIPDVQRFKIDNDMKLILIASDGIWENEKGLTSEHYISKFIQIAKKQNSLNVDECLEETCKEFVKWCMVDQLKLEYRNYGDNIALMVIGLLNGKNKEDWFREIQGWKGKYEDNSLIRDSDIVEEESNDDDIDYGSDSENFKIDFTQLS